jgi:hypothetical protein
MFLKSRLFHVRMANFKIWVLMFFVTFGKCIFFTKKKIIKCLLTCGCCTVDAGYEYSKGFVMAINEFNISGVRGVVQNPLPPSTLSRGGADKLTFKLYILF